ncbi:hypothetical protein EJ02DRAFT_207153 [Clathrospora elynae]|uniref:RlpA-like protein double-psi beta-barrel domain-containing protein n=1 Tax=Clathrospora elynae TaxID=706981 RepID=A0A6A5SRJ4_9PLEO|nr:hypothetical protein EJ02DRAFT_207153 [Clathrospora elynae]
MNTPVIPRKPLAESGQAHVKEVDSANTASASSWNAAEGSVELRRHHGFVAGIKTSLWSLSARFNHILPPHRRYIGHSRRTLLIMIGITFSCLIALIVGLAAGLTTRNNDNAIPFPNGAQTTNGDLTYYTPALGACGDTHGEDDAVVAISHYVFDPATPGTNPNMNSLCGRKIRAWRVDERTGKYASIDVTVVDKCMGCQANDLDVSPTMFKKLAAMDLGRVRVDWVWL